jgi:glycosyltransferase involved in cell wall biosynthesis
MNQPSSTVAPRRLLVVSHPCVVAVNQEVYVELSRRGWEISIVVPNRWRHEYSPKIFKPEPREGMEGALVPTRVLLPGRPQRHLYLVRASQLVRRLRPQVAFLEEEPFSIPAFQWGRTLAREGIPFGVQADENLDRPFPWVAKRIRSEVLSRAAFVAARSPAAGALVDCWGARGRVGLVPHAVPGWGCVRHGHRNGRFTIGFAGRLTPEKGVRDLVQAAAVLRGDTRLLFVGDGPLRTELEAIGAGGGCEVEVRTGVAHDRMPEAYAEMDVLVLPSRTTDRWAEQFGRVLVEALSCGVPVVGSDSGEIPWVVGATQGGRIFREGDASALAEVLGELRDDPAERGALACRGRDAVARLFSAPAAARSLEGLLVEALDAR